jgi:hypothetical protein
MGTGDDERTSRILARVTSDGTVEPTVGRVCHVGVELTATTGAAITLMAGDEPRGSLWSTDAVSAAIDELEFTLGEGPCVDAHRDGEPVLEPDLEHQLGSRWPAFSPAALRMGARAVFGFPINVGVTRLGSLNLYRDSPGPLSEEQHADACVIADVSARVLVGLEGRPVDPVLADELRGGANLRLVVHQASGMLSVQLGVSVEEALARLRAHAFANDQGLTEVAAHVVSRRLRFDESDVS